MNYDPMRFCQHCQCIKPRAGFVLTRARRWRCEDCTKRAGETAAWPPLEFDEVKEK